MAEKREPPETNVCLIPEMHDESMARHGKCPACMEGFPPADPRVLAAEAARIARAERDAR